MAKYIQHVIKIGTFIGLVRTHTPTVSQYFKNHLIKADISVKNSILIFDLPHTYKKLCYLFVFVLFFKSNLPICVNKNKTYKKEVVTAAVYTVLVKLNRFIYIFKLLLKTFQ